MPLTPGTRLGSYEIVEPIGAGGMGEVYRARDTKLGRDVAVKVLPEELASDRDWLQRFELEARAASALNHPNIITIHDFHLRSGEDDEPDYIVMEYVDGKTLREVLGGDPPPTEKLLRIGTQIAEGLAKAHQAGIVHRDLKPDNLMVTHDGFVKILDFGLAKVKARAPTKEPDSQRPTVTRHTSPGTVMGTAGYMSPEQAKGLQADFHSDQFSLGIILYEMASGQRAFREATPGETLAAIIRDQPVPIAQLNPYVPAPVRWIVERCLAKDPEERYASTSDLARELRDVRDHLAEVPSGPLPPAHLRPRRAALLWLVGLVVGVVSLVALNVGGLRERLTAPGRIESIAVLPLTNLSADPEQEYFADGMTEALIADLAKVGSLKVISRTSVMQYKGAQKPLTKIARELGVDAIIEGSALRVGDRVRITAQLIDAATDQHLWAESYDRDLRDVLALQSEVARAIVEEIQVKLTPQEDALLAGGRPVNPDAHEAYLRGRFDMSQITAEGYESAIELFEQALEKDPGYAVAYAAIGESYAMLSSVVDALPHGEAMPKAGQAALKALAIDSTLADAHATLAWIKYSYDWDWLEADKEFKLAIQLNPSSFWAHQGYAFFLSAMGRHDEAIAESRRGQETDPLSLAGVTGTAQILYNARQYDRALRELERALEMDPDFVQTHHLLSIVYDRKGMYAEKVVEDEKVLTLTGASSEVVASLGRAYEASGVRGFWEWWHRRLTEEARRRYVSDYVMAGVHTSLGDKDQAFEWLEKAYQTRHGDMVWLKVDPWLDPLRSDPRFQELLERMNFPE
jgi:serine/threonine protein kinase/tetratricopeptide (TPR) repeat protein